MEDLKIDTNIMQFKVDIMDIPTSLVLVICDGKVKLRVYKIVTHQGEVKRMRREEGEDF